jgi:hypothetical protein
MIIESNLARIIVLLDIRHMFQMETLSTAAIQAARINTARNYKFFLGHHLLFSGHPVFLRNNDPLAGVLFK